MNKSMIFIRCGVLVLAAGLLSSCGCYYDEEQITVREGSVLNTRHNGAYRLDRVDKDSITLSGLDGEHRQAWRLSNSGRWGGGEPHSLGNNEDLTILKVAPDFDSVLIELMWRDWCGPFSIPSF